MAVLGIGSKIRIGSNFIADLTTIGGVDIKADTLDTTVLDSVGGYREFIQGLKDAGEVPLSGYLNTSDANGQMALLTLINSGALTNFTILLPSALGASWDFAGIVTGFKTGDFTSEEFVPFEATIKISGKPTLGLIASGGLTALTLTGTGGTLTPTFSNGNFLYSFSGLTATSFTVTPTAASHTISLYVDGAFVQTVTSATASSAIAMATVGSKKVTILAQETGKVAKVYEITAVKTS
jgi:predicted secreted protein